MSSHFIVVLIYCKSIIIWYVSVWLLGVLVSFECCYISFRIFSLSSFPELLSCFWAFLIRHSRIPLQFLAEFFSSLNSSSYQLNFDILWSVEIFSKLRNLVATRLSGETSAKTAELRLLACWLMCGSSRHLTHSVSLKPSVLNLSSVLFRNWWRIAQSRTPWPLFHRITRNDRFTGCCNGTGLPLLTPAPLHSVMSPSQPVFSPAYFSHTTLSFAVSFLFLVLLLISHWCYGHIQLHFWLISSRDCANLLSIIYHWVSSAIFQFRYATLFSFSCSFVFESKFYATQHGKLHRCLA